MLKQREEKQFKKDMNRAMSQGKPYSKIKAVFVSLVNQEPLNPSLKDHPLQGSWKGHRELHIQTDWLLIYRIEDNTLILNRTGTHSELFRGKK